MRLISEDENKSFEKDIQKLTDDNVAKIEKISKEKCQPLEAVRFTIERLRGSFALCFIFRDTIFTLK